MCSHGSSYYVRICFVVSWRSSWPSLPAPVLSRGASLSSDCDDTSRSNRKNSGHNRQVFLWAAGLRNVKAVVLSSAILRYRSSKCARSEASPIVEMAILVSEQSQFGREGYFADVVRVNGDQEEHGCFKINGLASAFANSPIQYRSFETLIPL